MLNTLPATESVYVIRYKKPGLSADLAVYFDLRSAKRRAQLVTDKGGEAHVFLADASNWRMV